jgi:hypothetical protein
MEWWRWRGLNSPKSASDDKAADESTERRLVALLQPSSSSPLSRTPIKAPAAATCSVHSTGVSGVATLFYKRRSAQTNRSQAGAQDDDTICNCQFYAKAFARGQPRRRQSVVTG